MVNFVIVMLITSITGGILVLVWLGIGSILEKMGFINIVYELLKMVIIFFFVPVSYIGLRLFEYRLGRGFLFVPVSLIQDNAGLILILWGCAAVCGLCALLWEYMSLFWYFRNAMTAGKAQQQLLAEVCQEMKFPLAKAELKMSYHVHVPCVMGIRKARIVLPIEEFDKETFRIILIHELTHFKQKDLLLKNLSLLVLVLHFYNPLAWFLFSKIQKWSEFACDYRASIYCNGIKNYFEVLVQVASDETKFGSLSSQLYENRHELVERVRKMSKVKKFHKRTSVGAVLVVCMAFMLSSISVGATTVQAAKAYEYLYRVSELTSSLNESSDIVDEYIEYAESGDSSGITLIERPMNAFARSTYVFNWEVDGRCRVSAAWHDLTAGQKVSVTASMVPVNVEVRVGLERDNGTRRYVVGTDIVNHIFNVEENGRYRVYIQNDTYEDVTVDGGYLIK